MSKRGFNKKTKNMCACPDVVFTCTSFLDFDDGDRWERLCRALDTLFKLHSRVALARIRSMHVINEFSDKPKRDWTRLMAQRFPTVHFIAKTEADRGQARSLNMLRTYWQDATYWIHWEECWESERPWLEDALTLMETTDLSQLQLTRRCDTTAWLDTENPRTHEGRLVRIHALPLTAYPLHKCALRVNLFPWPLYSLQPSINRVSFFRKLGRFNEHPALWPWRFEWDMARRWLLAGGVKGVFVDGPVVRGPNYTSTCERR